MKIYFMFFVLFLLILIIDGFYMEYCLYSPWLLHCFKHEWGIVKERSKVKDAGKSNTTK